jgi:broad specificity phosphatase PhoE
MSGSPPEVIRAQRRQRVDAPFPNGESLRDVAERVRSFLDEVALNWDGKRVVVIGHSATKLALDHLLGGLSLEDAAAQPHMLEPIPPSYRYVLEL